MIDTASLVSPQRFASGAGPSWIEFVEALSILDRQWRLRRLGNTAFGVFGERPSWEDTIARGQRLFDAESWSSLTEDDQSLLAPAHTFEHGDALLGSIGRRSDAVRSFLSPKAEDDRNKTLNLLRQARSLRLSSLPLLGGDLLDEMCEIRGMGRSFATRLLTLARPDGLVVLNNKSKEWLSKASGLSLAGKGRSYGLLLKWLSRQRWYQGSEPSDQIGKQAWRIRAALLDAFAYEPH